MNITICFSGDLHLKKVSVLRELVATLPKGTSLQEINLSDPPPEGVPAEVLRIIMNRSWAGVPVTLIDSKPILIGKFPTPFDILSYFHEGDQTALVARVDSAVDFSTSQRIHISLNVRNLEVSVPFYMVLFDQVPIKMRPDYAKFELESPALNLTLNVLPFTPPEEEGPVGHFGIQVKKSEDLLRARGRYIHAGFNLEQETQTACCYSVQTKVWVRDPDGNHWEIFLTTEPDSEAGCGPDCICLICYKQMQPSFVQPVAS